MNPVHELSEHDTEVRPWGMFERFTKGEPSTVKIITVKEGEAFSLQMHAHRDEFWRVVSGEGTVRVGEEDHEAHPGDNFYIKRGTKHRATAGTAALTILEIAFGDFDENDITRFEDRYGRVTAP